MDMKHDIRQAFDSVHASDALVEKIKQELYQKDHLSSFEEESFEAIEAPRASNWKAGVFVAAVLALCIGCGGAIFSLRTQINDFNPGSSVTVTEEVTESPSETDFSES